MADVLRIGTLHVDGYSYVKIKHQRSKGMQKKRIYHGCLVRIENTVPHDTKQ